jgi:hypothetical protein
MKIISRIIGIIFLIMLCVTYTGAASAGQAVLSWDAPTTNEDGTPLTDLAGYKIYWGTAPGTYTQSKDVGNVITYTITGLPSGKYFFAVTAYNVALMESGKSNEVSKEIPKSNPSAPTGCSVK